MIIKLGYLELTPFQSSLYAIKASMLSVSFLIANVSLSFASELGFCDKTTEAAQKACYHEVKDDYWIDLGNCNNLSDLDSRLDCILEAKETLRENKQLCKQQAEGRAAVCDSIGQAPYDPIIDPDQFINPLEIGNSIAPNPYFPLIAGTTRIYKSGLETITVTVTNRTKLIMGVTCLVVTDIVEEDGEFVEVTDDWYAQDLNGNVWYFGEIAKNFENGELTDLEGSWKAGVDGAKAGFIMKAAPYVGDVYRQEFALANAEDMGRVLSLTGNANVAVASCNNDCLVTHDFTPIEPTANEQKYYAPGIGFILEIKPDTGERVELIDFKQP